jgi:group I intron endonuclease
VHGELEGNRDQGITEHYGVVYKITCVLSGKCYVGITKHSSAKRWATHVYEANYTAIKGCKLLNSAIRKYGRDAFLIADIAYGSSEEELLRMETEFIRNENTLSPNGYNLNEGGCGNLNPSDETRRRISSSLTGKKFSEDRCRRMSISRTGLKLGPMAEETKRKIGDANRGKKRSPELCREMSRQRTGVKRVPHTEQTKNKISGSLKGQKLKPERVSKICDTVRSRPNYGITIRGKGYRGLKNFRVRIGIDGRTTHIGDYDTYEEAVYARDAAIILESAHGKDISYQ